MAHPQSFQLHIQLPETYLQQHPHPHAHAHLHPHPHSHAHAPAPVHRGPSAYYGTPVGTPTTPGSEFFSGDESPSDARKAREMAPFLRNLRNMLERESPEVLRWNKDGTAFEIHDMDEMMNTVLPKYFKHKKYTSFQRQLNYFNFKKWTKSRANVCTFSNELFTRNEPYRSAFITRKKSMSGSAKEANANDTGDEYDDASEDRRRQLARGCDSPCSSVYSCDSPLPSRRESRSNTLDLSFQSMTLQKSRMSTYENKHLTRVMGNARRPVRKAETRMSEEFDWLGESDFESFRDSLSSMTSTTSGEWEDPEMNWVDLLQGDTQMYNNPAAQPDLSPLRVPYPPNNSVNFFAAI